MSVGIARLAGRGRLAAVCRTALLGGAGWIALPADRAAAAPPAPVEVTGSRLSIGNAVDCPTIRTDDRAVHAVSWLPPALAIGERVTVRGSNAVTTRCVGRVIAVEEGSAGEGGP